MELPHEKDGHQAVELIKQFKKLVTHETKLDKELGNYIYLPVQDLRENEVAGIRPLTDTTSTNLSVYVAVTQKSIRLKFLNMQVFA